MSFHNVHDISFVTGSIEVDRSWIGLTTNRADGWMWSDSTAVQVIGFFIFGLTSGISTQTGKKANHQVPMKIVSKCIPKASGMMLSVVAQKVGFSLSLPRIINDSSLHLRGANNPGIR